MNPHSVNENLAFEKGSRCGGIVGTGDERLILPGSLYSKPLITDT
jgi:hypothetical protein